MLLFLALGLVMLGCSDAGLVEVDNLSETGVGGEKQPLAGKSSEVKYVPYKETGHGEVTTDPEAELGMVCVGAEVEGFAKSYIHATGLGDVIGYDHDCKDFSTLTARGRTKIISNKGDYLLMEAECAVVDIATFGYRCEVTVVGGSGRFENASTPPAEPIIKTGNVDTSTGNGTWTAVGRISSVGSSD